MDEISDLQLNVDRDIYLNGTNDLSLTEGIETVEQSVGIELGAETTQLLGTQLDGANLRKFGADVERRLNNDPQISTVEDISITSVNQNEGFVEFSVRTVEDETFTIQI
jgi:ethanolamine utilization protein EutA (predicted chaperonin)